MFNKLISFLLLGAIAFNVDAGGTFIKGTQVHVLKSKFSFQGVSAIMDMASGDISLEPAAGRYVLFPANVLNIGSSAPPSTNADITLNGTGALMLKEQSSDPSADANYHKIYVRDDDRIYYQDGAGGKHDLLASGLLVTQFIHYTGHAGYGSSSTKIPYFTTATENSGPGLLSVLNDSTNGFVLTANRKCLVFFTWNIRESGNSQAQLGWSLNASSPVTANINGFTPANQVLASSRVDTGTNSLENASGSIVLESGDVIRPHGNAAATSNVGSVLITAIAMDKAAVSVADSSLTNWTSYTPTITGFGTPTAVDFRFRQVGDSYEILGRFVSGTPTAVEAQVSLPNSGAVLSGFITKVSSGVWFREVAIAQKGGSVLITPGDAFINFSAGGIFSGDAVNPSVPALGSAMLSNGQGMLVSVTVPIEGLDGTAQFLALIPVINHSALVVDGASSTTVSEDDKNFIDGNCTNGSAGDYTCPFITNFFTLTPHCWAQAIDTHMLVNITRNGATDVRIRFALNDGTLTDTDFLLFCKSRD